MTFSEVVYLSMSQVLSLKRRKMIGLTSGTEDPCHIGSLLSRSPWDLGCDRTGQVPHTLAGPHLHSLPSKSLSFSASGSFPMWDNQDMQRFNAQPIGDGNPRINVSFPNSEG